MKAKRIRIVRLDSSQVCDALGISYDELKDFVRTDKPGSAVERPLVIPKYSHYGNGGAHKYSLSDLAKLGFLVWQRRLNKKLFDWIPK